VRESEERKVQGVWAECKESARVDCAKCQERAARSYYFGFCPGRSPTQNSTDCVSSRWLQETLRRGEEFWSNSGLLWTLSGLWTSSGPALSGPIWYPSSFPFAEEQLQERLGSRMHSECAGFYLLTSTDAFLFSDRKDDAHQM